MRDHIWCIKIHVQQRSTRSSSQAQELWAVLHIDRRRFVAGRARCPLEVALQQGPLRRPRQKVRNPVQQGPRRLTQAPKFIEKQNMSCLPSVKVKGSAGHARPSPLI